jgi:hypothetical protein
MQILASSSIVAETFFKELMTRFGFIIEMEMFFLLQFVFAMCEGALAK